MGLGKESFISLTTNKGNLKIFCQKQENMKRQSSRRNILCSLWLDFNNNTRGIRRRVRMFLGKIHNMAKI